MAAMAARARSSCSVEERKMVTQELLNWVNNFLLRNAARYRPTATGGWEPGGPTQQDKPSPKSSLTANYLSGKLRQIFKPQGGYQVSRVANTNSMEPLLDDSDVVVLEELTGEQREPRLTRQPFAPGQVVIYPSTVGRIIHTLKTRTTFLGKPAWIIQGANNFLPDMAKVPEEKIEARLVAIAYGRSVREGD